MGFRAFIALKIRRTAISAAAIWHLTKFGMMIFTKEGNTELALY